MNLRNKRGSENLTFQAIMTIIFVLALFAVLLFFLVNNASGNLAKKQLLAKQLCLVMTESKPGTTINLTFDGLVERKETGFMIKKDKTDVVGYYYPCYGKDFSVVQDGKYWMISIN
jgi:hypothetical protein